MWFKDLAHVDCGSEVLSTTCDTLDAIWNWKIMDLRVSIGKSNGFITILILSMHENATAIFHKKKVHKRQEAIISDSCIYA